MNYTANMKEKVRKIRSIIQNDFDERMELALFSYMFDKGIEDLQKFTDEQIEEEIQEGNGLMTRDFILAMVKTACKLSREFTTIELMQYVRMELWMAPNIQEIAAYRTKNGNYEIEESSHFDLDKKEVAILHVIVEDCED